MRYKYKAENIINKKDQYFILCDKNCRIISRISSNINFIIRFHSLWNTQNIIFLFNIKIWPYELRQ